MKRKLDDNIVKGIRKEEVKQYLVRTRNEERSEESLSFLWKVSVTNELSRLESRKKSI